MEGLFPDKLRALTKHDKYAFKNLFVVFKKTTKRFLSYFCTLSHIYEIIHNILFHKYMIKYVSRKKVNNMVIEQRTLCIKKEFFLY